MWFHVMLFMWLHDMLFKHVASCQVVKKFVGPGLSCVVYMLASAAL